jgi:aminoglycoside 3-N-acetyltransferase
VTGAASAHASGSIGGNSWSARQLGSDLRHLGVERGTTLLVHCSMRRIGWVEGGAATLRDALLSVLDESAGTLVVPAQTRSKSQTSAEFLEAVAHLDDAGRSAFLDALPGFDREHSPTEGMGALAEAVRLHPHAHRSAHPLTSFAAIGARAREVCASHPLDCLLGKQSPLGALYELGAQVLLLGVGFDKCTAFHLGEDAAAASGERHYTCKIGDTWEKFDDLAHQDDDFTELGRRFAERRPRNVRAGRVGSAHALVFPVQDAADFAASELPHLRLGY